MAVVAAAGIVPVMPKAWTWLFVARAKPRRLFDRVTGVLELHRLPAEAHHLFELLLENPR